MESHQSPFAAVDAQAAQQRAAMIAYLADAAGNAEIRRVRAEAEALAPPRPGDRVLDAGCGIGEVAGEWAARVAPHGEVVGVDRSRDLVHLAAERSAAPNVHFVHGDITGLDFPDRHFDLARAERVIQHLPEPAAALAELVRVVRPGGAVCVVDTDWASLLIEGVDPALVASVGEEARAAGFPVGQTAGRQLHRRLAEAGLVELRVRPVTLAFTDVAAAAQVLPFLRDASGTPFDTPAGRRFQGAVREAERAGRLLCGLTMWAVAGTRR